MGRTSDIAIVGGGPAGAAMAIRLARMGADVVLFERSTAAHDTVCGEFLESAAVGELESLGIDATKLGGRIVSSLSVIRGTRTIDSDLPRPGVALERRTLDEYLLDRARAAGATVVRGTGVRSFERARSGYVVQIARKNHQTRHLVIATGKHDLKGLRRYGNARRRFVGLKLHLDLPPARCAALDGRIVLMPFRRGYAGLQGIGGSRVNLCLVSDAAMLGDVTRDWRGLPANLLHDHPVLQDSLADAVPCWPKPLAVGHLPYGYIRGVTDGPWWLGDQAAVVPSLVGTGVAVALRSARRAADILLSGGCAQDYQQAFARELRAPMRRMLALSRVALHPSAAATLIGAVQTMPALMPMLARACVLPGPR